MTKKTTSAIMVGAIVAAIVFCAFAFTMWDLNPSHWDTDVRAACALVMLLSIGLVIGIIMAES
jgi:hypothetical protein